MSQKFAFVIMSFDENFKGIYKRGIKKACEDLGIRCERLDEQNFNEPMVERIYKQIFEADYVIADMSKDERGLNPNVFYEAGYARGIDKILIPLTQEVGTIPFDMQQYRHIVYDAKKISKLKNALIENLTWQLDVTKDLEYTEIERKILQLEIRLNNIRLDRKIRNQIPIAISQEYFNDPAPTYTVSMNLSIRNISITENIVLPICEQHFVIPNDLLANVSDDIISSLSPDKNLISIGDHLSVWKCSDIGKTWDWEFYNPMELMNGKTRNIEYHCQMFKYDIEFVFIKD